LDELIPTALPRFQSQLLQCAAKTKRILVSGGHTFSITIATDVQALRMMESAHRIVSAQRQRSDDRYFQLWKQANRTLNASPVLEFQSNYKAITSRIDGFFAFLKLMRPEQPLSEIQGWDMLTSITPETLSAAVTHATNFAI
jgi:hypothetical protein